MALKKGNFLKGFWIGVLVFGIVILLFSITSFATENPEEGNDPSESVQDQSDMNKIRESLFEKEFRYYYVSSLPNPFYPFVKPVQEEATSKEKLEDLVFVEPVLLTPLQKMELGEIERGFKGVLWSDRDKKAIIEDSTGKGYIVSVGTPIGNQDGVVSAIFEDRLIIRQKVWDKKAKDFVDEEVIVKLRKLD